ncbi:arginyl-tRNA synthetase, mitochondrial isoform X2 [Dermatophagoides pteronyssinus]
MDLIVEHQLNDGKKKIIVEYSSPNIAKPFHVGNLRSTIIGNSIANILEFYGNNVIRMNYLGDWGTQFGILSLAYDQFGDPNKLQCEPLKHLFNVYVDGNRKCDSDIDWRNQAKNRFYQLETNDSRIYEQWYEFRRLSIEELEKLYKRLGIQFDRYESESMYSQSINDIIQMIQQQQLIKIVDGATCIEIDDSNQKNKKLAIPLLKNDGTSLYLTRDLAAVINRQKHYNFDQMYYVVDSSQSKHFNNLKNIFHSLNNPVYRNLEHLKFGRILGMSTRKGEAIFLDDVLNEAKHRSLEAIKTSQNTKIPIEQYETIADILGVSAIIVNDLSNRRVSEYRFNWNRALRMNGNTGISLQYTHARLCNLIKKSMNNDDDDYQCSSSSSSSSLNLAAIHTLEGRNLINQLLMFDEIIDQAYNQLEPSILTNYMFDLKTAINRANQELTIKGQPKSIQQTRLLLFICAKNVLNQCMRLIGLQPLESM